MFNKSLQVYYVAYVSEAYYVQDDDVAWLNIVNDNIGSAFMSTSKLNDSILWHARLGYVYYKRMQDMSKDGLIPAFHMDTETMFFYVYLLYSKDEALDKFKVFKTEVKLQQGSLIKRFGTDRGGLIQGFWGKAMLTACYLLNRVPNKRNMITPYELWTKRKLNLNYLRVWGCRAVVRLLDPKLKTLGERGIEFIFVGYVEHFKAFRTRTSMKLPMLMMSSVVFDFKSALQHESSL
ncbi:zinc finger, CCHC-type containing protein [Tanacetum coccineum]